MVGAVRRRIVGWIVQGIVDTLAVLLALNVYMIIVDIIDAIRRVG
jgi:hypothetical protein